MKKLLTLLFVGTVLYSCSTENTETDPVTEPTATNFQTQFEQGMFDNTKTGIYQGIFTTLDGSSRSTVFIKIDGKNEPTAEFGFPDETKAAATSGNQVTKSSEANTMTFKGDNFNFDFTVGENGSNPTITNVIYNGLKGDVMMMKATSKAPVVAKTGTYSCLDCKDHPELGKPGAVQTFNTMYAAGKPTTQSEARNGVINIQTTLNDNVYFGTMTNSNCSAGRGLTSCDLNGTIAANSGPVTVTGTHIFDNSYPTSTFGDCSDMEGNFVYHSTLFGRLTLKYKTDAPGNCFPDPDTNP